MYGTRGKHQMWCLGLEEGDLACVRSCVGDRLDLVAFAEDADVASLERDWKEPILLWLGSQAWKRFQDDESAVRCLRHLPRVLVLQEDSPRADIESALQGGFQDVLLGCDNTERVYEALNRALELCNVSQDMGRMTREILMHRELLLRKSDAFGFLQGFVAAVSRAQNAVDALRGARAQFGDLFPVLSMHVARWRTGGEQGPEVILFMDARQEPGSVLEELSEDARGWADLLLSAAMSLVPLGGAIAPVFVWFSQHPLRPVPCSAHDDLPDTRHTLLLPMCVGTCLEGLVALHLERDFPRGRDQVLALDAAVSHLGMTLRSFERAGRGVSAANERLPSVVTAKAATPSRAIAE